MLRFLDEPGVHGTRGARGTLERHRNLSDAIEFRSVDATV
jgi:hypothetical protein